MSIHHVRFVTQTLIGLCINLLHFALVNLVVLGAFTTILGGWVVRKIENKDQLSPVEVEIGNELGNKEDTSRARQQKERDS